MYMFNDVHQDFRYVLRGLSSSPGFAAMAILSLALGIGANTAIFSLIKAIVLRTLSGADTIVSNSGESNTYPARHTVLVSPRVWPHRHNACSRKKRAQLTSSR